MIELPSMRPHQDDQIARGRTALTRNRAVIFCAPPGTGKTRMAKWMLGSSLNREPSEGQSGYSMFAVHRRALVENASDSFAESPELPHGLIMSGKGADVKQRVQVASIDTVVSWFCEGGTYDSSLTFDFIVFDETHSHFPKLQTFLKAHDAERVKRGLRPCYVLGLSATPEAKGLADLYGEIVKGPSTQWLIDNGWLSPFRYFRATEGQLGKLIKKGGEFTSDSVAAAMDGLSGDLVRDWKQHAEGRATIGFFPRLSHAKEAQAALRAAGIDAEYVDGTTPDDKRKSLFRGVNEGYIPYLCNVGVVERGTDIPRVGCVQLCTAIGSRVRYLQMIGRGSRVHPGVSDCLVLDHGGSIKRHGFFEDDYPWSLDVSVKDATDQAARPTIECPKCSAIYRGGKCKLCGYEPTPKERKSQGLEFDGAELVEVKPKEQSKPAGKTPQQLMVEALYKSGHTGRTWKQCVGIYYRLNEKQGTRHRVPRMVEVGGNRYEMIRAGSDDSGRTIATLYPFTVNRGNHGGEYLVQEPSSMEATL